MADTIPLHHAQSLLRLAPVPDEQLREQLLELNLPLVLLEQKTVAEARIPVEDYGRLFIHLVHQLQQDLLPGEDDPENTVLFSAYRMMFQAMLHSRNLEQALQRASVYFKRLHSQGESFRLEKDGDTVHCCFDFSDEQERSIASPQNFSMAELNWLPGLTGRVLSMAMWHRVCGWFIGSFIDLKSVQMKQTSRPDKDFGEIFGMPVQFGADRYVFSFHSHFLEFPIVQSEDSLNVMLETYPADLFRISPQDHSLTVKIRNLIGSDFQRPLPNLQDVADRLHMTTPTLHRRLRDEGTSFQQLKDHSRRDAAINHLACGQHTTADLAELMGFSDSSTFHRAFKKWTGLTPQDYKARHL